MKALLLLVGLFLLLTGTALVVWLIWTCADDQDGERQGRWLDVVTGDEGRCR